MKMGHDEQTASSETFSVAERALIDRTLQFVAGRSSRATGTEFFDELVKYLGEALEVAYAVCGKIGSPDDTVLQTLSVYANGKISENISYDLKDTPCENVIGRSLCCYVDKVQQQFPRDQLLFDLDSESYFGIPLWAADGSPLGLIYIMDKKPLRSPDLIKTVLQIVAVRAGAELERAQILFNLQSSEQRFVDFAEVNSDWFWEMDENLRFSYLSEQFETYMTIPRAMMLGKTREETGIPGVDPDAWANHLRDLSAHRRFESFVHPRTNRAGDTFWVSANGKPIFDNNNLFLGYRGSAKDITKRKLAEDALLEAHDNLEIMVGRRTVELEKARERAEAASELFSKAFHASPMLFSIASPENGSHYEVNEKWSTISGYSHAEAMQRSAKELGLWALPDQRHIFVEEIRSNGFVRDFEAVLRTKSGVQKDLLYSGEMITYKGKDCMLVVGQDITDRNELDRIKSEFISSVSHELRTPLTAIRGALGMIEGGALTNPEDHRQMVKLASRNTRSLINLVDDLLDIGKLQSGEMEILQEKVSLTEIVKEAVNINKPYADEYDVKFKLKEAETDATVYGDPSRLGQVVTNLLSNAAKFSPKHGEVVISVKRSENSICVSVSDSGPGVPDEFRTQIFERFTQADAKDTKAKGGTGLGLNISKSIVELHNGEIGFASNSGGGSTFFFTLPICE